ncbi:MAG: hypothetical protein HY754_05240 [Nitrospirae bacterium]|nr:hypothetical protein [Nitrospirota bacterium]
MKKKITISLFVIIVFVFGIAGIGLTIHEEKGTIRGTVTEIKIIEIELTVKDDKGKETKVKSKDGAFKPGDHVIIKDGKVSKEVKPITGGY